MNVLHDNKKPVNKNLLIAVLMVAFIAAKIKLDKGWVTDLAMIALIAAAVINIILYIATPKRDR